MTSHLGERKRSGSDLFRAISSSGSARRSIFEVPPHLAAPEVVGSYESYRSWGTYGTVDSAASDLSHASSMARAADLWRQRQRQEPGGPGPGERQPPILVKEVEQEGRIVLAVSGQSTLPQTVMNATK